MGESRELTEEQINRLDEFLNVTLCLSDEELEALDKRKPMTQKMFEKCCEKLSEIGANENFFELLFEYPDYLRESAKEIEAELNKCQLSGMPKMTDEEIKESYLQLFAKIEKESEV